MKNTIVALVLGLSTISSVQANTQAATIQDASHGYIIPVGEALIGQRFIGVSSSGERQLFTKTIDGGSFIVAFNEETMATQLFLPTQPVLVREVL